RAPQRGGVVGQSFENLAPVGQVVGIPHTAAHAVLPHPVTVGTLAQVAGQALGPHLLAVGQVGGDLGRRLVEGGEGLVGPEEVDDAADAFLLQAVADVD